MSLKLLREILNLSIKKSNLSFKESSDGIQNGTLDACFVTAGVPNAALQELAVAKGLVLISVDGECADYICDKYSFYTKTTIPGGTYKGSDEDVSDKNGLRIKGCRNRGRYPDRLAKR